MTDDIEIKWEVFKIDLEKEEELKIDDFNDISNSFMETILEAEKQALFLGIKNNAIVLNKDLDYTNEFFVSSFSGMMKVPPMVLGKKVFLASLPKEYTFALVDTEEETTLEDLLKKYVKVVNGQLIFKNISYKKNKEDYVRIVNELCIKKE